MKNKSSLLILAAAALLVSCGYNGNAQNSSNADSSQQTQPSLTSEVSSDAETSTSGASGKEESSKQEGSSQAESSKDHSNTSYPTQSDEESTSYDLSGVVEQAVAPEGVVLTDWTDEMKVILKKYLNNHLPPFLFVEGLTVTYDELGYLTVSGSADDTTLSTFVWDVLENDPDTEWAAMQDAASRLHVYTRTTFDDGIIEGDALVANGVLSILYSFTPYITDWPEGYVYTAMTEYGSNAVVPVLPADKYIAGITYMYEVDILCIGASQDYLETYAAALEENRWTVTKTTVDGVDDYVAVSLDALAVLEFYYDGTGIQIILNHGDGEVYSTWEDCLAAIDDFAVNDLRLENGISDAIPEVDGGLQYSIDRSINGRLIISALKNSSFRINDIISYREELRAAGFVIDESKSTDENYIVCAYPEDQSYAIRIELSDYISDLGDVTSMFMISIQDYRIYDGYVVKNTWPEDMVATIVNLVAPGQSITAPGYYVEGATYYAKSNYSDEIVIDILNPGEDAINTYKTGLQDDYGFRISEEEGVVTAVDRKKQIQITFSLVNGEMHVVVRRYVEPLDVEGDEATLEFNANTITSNENGWWMDVVWGSSPFYFEVEQGTSSAFVGNSGDYISPLRLYNNQTVTIAPAEGKSITKIQFYAVEARKGNGSLVSGFDVDNVASQTIEGATFVSYNANTGMATYTVSDEYQQTGVSFTVNGQFALESVVVTIA